MIDWLKNLIVRCWPSKRSKPAELPSTEVLRVEIDELLFPAWPPPSPKEILSRREFYKDRMRHRKYRAPEGVFEDSPLFALYRLYEWIMVDHTVNLRNEIELFWWAGWPVSTIPDPGEQGEPDRYAVLACIPALLVASFNERIEKGLRREEPHAILSVEEQLQWAATPKRFEAEPPWAESVPPLSTLLHIPHSQPGRDQLATIEDPDASPEFRKKNILAIKPHIHFI